MFNFYRRVIKYLKKNGILSFFSRTKRYIFERKFVKSYYDNVAINDEMCVIQKGTKLEYNPLISIIIPLYNTPINFFHELMETIEGQTYSNWELCLADGTAKETELKKVCEEYAGKDGRIKYKLLDSNGGISDNTNAALKMATGDFVFLADHDDLLEKDALFEVVKAINENSMIDSLYSDEDKIAKRDGRKFEPHLKPDYNIEYLRTNNYICHIFVTRRDIALDVGGFSKEYDGAQDYDFILKCCEKSRYIHHIPRILYHWRSNPSSTATNPENKLYAYESGARALASHYRRSGIEAAVRNDGLHYGYYIADRSINKEILKDVLIINDDNVKTINDMIAKANTEYIFLVDKQIRFTKDSILKMLEYAREKEVAAVTCKILTSKKRLIQGPIVIDREKIYKYKMNNSKSTNPGYFRCMTVAQNVALADYRCVIIKKSIFCKNGGFDENLSLGLAVFDYSLKSERDKLRTVYTPYTNVFYTGKCNVPQYEKKELDVFRKKWFDRIMQGDSYYNENFNLCEKAFF